jgi:HPt (histidine-containing phosphotransfer) domain-containing protein
MTPADYFKQHVGACIFDCSRLESQLSRYPGRSLAMLDVLERFIKEGVAPLQPIRDACQRNQLAQAAHMLYNLNGYIQNIGGNRVSELADEIETLLSRDANVQVLDELLNCLEREYLRLVKSIQAWLSEFKQKNTQNLALNHLHLTTQLNYFKLCLNEHSFKAFDVLQELENKLQQQMDANSFAYLQVSMANLDFDSALGCIEKAQFVHY